MTDRATPNLPSADFDRTEAFYEQLGFRRGFRDDGWMILDRGTLTLEFFPHQTDPRTTIASSCLRVDDLDGLHAAFSGVGISTSCWAIPRIGSTEEEAPGLRVFYLVDPDGNLIRCVQTRPAGKAD